MTCQGEYSREWIEAWNQLYPDDPRTFTTQPKVLFGGAGFGGKLAPLDSHVLTPFGWREMGDIKVGMMVSTPDGSIARVLAVWPQGVKPVYRVTFNDGGSYECGAEHLWLARRRTGLTKRVDHWRIRTTSMLKPGMAIPVTEPVVFTSTSGGRRRPLDPYLVGVVLGDGCCVGSGITLTCFDPEIVERLVARGAPIWPLKRDGVYRISTALTTRDWKRLGISGKGSLTKRIPPGYLLGTPSERWDLLRGLMDTDGWADKDGGICFCSASEGLADDVIELVRSLGGLAWKTYKRNDHAGAWNVAIALRDPSLAFSLGRKKDRAVRRRAVERTVKSIELVREAECQCITIDAPDGLYIGDDYVVTHNSHTIRACMVELHACYVSLGVDFPITAIIANSYPNLADWQIRELKRKYRDWGEVKENHTFGVHFAFFEQSLGVCLLRNADKPDKRGGNILSAQIDEASLISWEFVEDIMYAVRGADAPFNSLGFSSNPDGPYAAKLKKLFVDRDFADEPPDSTIRAEDFLPIIRCFVWDNPVATDSDHRRLKGFANEALVKARYYGEWEILTGLRFPQFSRKVHTFSWEEFCDGYGIPKLDDPAMHIRPEDGFTVQGSLDFGTAMDSATAFYLHAVDWKRRVWTFEELWLEGTPLYEQIPEIAKLLKHYKVARIYYDPSLDGKDDDGLARADKFRRAFREMGINCPMIAGSRDRIERWATMDELFHYTKNPDPPHEIITPPQLKILRAGAGVRGCPKLIGQIGEAPRHVTPTGNKLEDIDPAGGKWHGIDSSSYFYHSWFRGGTKVEPDYKPMSNGWLRQRWDANRQKKKKPYGW